MTRVQNVLILIFTLYISFHTLITIYPNILTVYNLQILKFHPWHVQPSVYLHPTQPSPNFSCWIFCCSIYISCSQTCAILWSFFISKCFPCVISHSAVFSSSVADQKQLPRCIQYTQNTTWRCPPIRVLSMCIAQRKSLIGLNGLRCGNLQNILMSFWKHIFLLNLKSTKMLKTWSDKNGLPKIPCAWLQEQE